VSWLSAVLIVVAMALGVACALVFDRWRRNRALQRNIKVRRIAFPFTGEALSEPALVAALRIARVEGAILMPVYLALVPRRLAIDVPLQAQCDVALPLLEAIEQRASRAEVAVDSRIERGRSVRHALRELMAHEHFERMVVAASSNGLGEGITPEDIAWLFVHGDGELIALRPLQTPPGTIKLTTHPA
jgi:hypothetical protein